MKNFNKILKIVYSILGSLNLFLSLKIIMIDLNYFIGLIFFSLSFIFFYLSLKDIKFCN